MAQKENVFATVIANIVLGIIGLILVAGLSGVAAIVVRWFVSIVR
jgi:hypothetical protein